MKLFRYLLILLLPTLFVLTSCGSDDDDGGGSSSTTTGTTGGGGPDEETDPSCLTETRRRNITNVLNRLTDRGSFDGEVTSRTRQADGSLETSLFKGGYTVVRESNSKWRVGGGFCEVGGGDCFDTETVFEFRNGCFFDGEDRARIRSTTINSVSYSTTPSQGRTVTTSAAFLANGRIRINETLRDNGRTTQTWRFLTIPSDGGTSGGTDSGSTTGDDGSTTGSNGSTTGDNGTTTGDTGTTTGGTGATTGDAGTTTGTTTGLSL